jgi:hypothetical protein
VWRHGEAIRQKDRTRDATKKETADGRLGQSSFSLLPPFGLRGWQLQRLQSLRRKANRAKGKREDTHAKFPLLLSVCWSSSLSLPHCHSAKGCSQPPSRLPPPV